MEQAIEVKRKRKKRKNSFNNRLFLILVAAAFVIYLITSFISTFSNYETEPAVHVTVNDSFTATGWFFRDETPISGSSGDSVKHIVYSGERVHKDAGLAIVYSDEEALALSREIEPLDNRIELLDTALQAASDSSDAAQLDQMITQSIQQLDGLIKSGSGSALATSANSLRMLSLRHEATNLDATALSTERDTLEAERASLEQQLSGRTSELSAPTSGYYSEVVDGYENVLTLDQLDSLTIEGFHELTQGAEQVDSNQVLGKIIEGFTWYLVAEVPAEQADRLSVGQDLRVNFTQASLESPVTVYSILDERGSETSLLVLEGTEFNSEMVSMREQPVEIILQTYSGLKVPKAAVRMEPVTDSEGNVTERTVVYILSGGVQKSKIIKTLYETEDYYVVEQSATNADMLVEQDQIIVSGRNLQNNMVVRT